MIWRWLIGGVVGSLAFGLFPKLWKIWNKFDDQEKKEIIEVIVNIYKEIFRAYYKWYENKGKE